MMVSDFGRQENGGRVDFNKHSRRFISKQGRAVSRFNFDDHDE